MEKFKQSLAATSSFNDLLEQLLAWLEPYIAYLRENPILAYALIGIAGLLLFVIIISVCVGAKRKKARKALQAQQTIQAAAPIQEPITEEPAPVEETPVVERPITEEPAPVAETPVVEESFTEEPAPIEEEPIAEEPAPIEEEPVVEESFTEEPAPVEETPLVEESFTEEPAPIEEEPIPEEPAPIEQAPAAPMLYDELKDVEEENEIWYDENETDIAARYSGKWQICRVLTDDASTDEMYFFELRASNGEKLLSSEEYTSYQGALRGIQTHKANIQRDNFRITLSKKGDYIFKLLSGKNMLLCMGENYPTRARCERAIESAKRFAKTAVIDENVQDHIIKIPVEDDNEILPLPEGYNGKWIISSRINENGETTYWFELFANNGEKLLSSEDYTSYVGAVNGIQTHKTNIEKGNFRISLTKRGDYIYKLLNGNGQLLCLGEHYKTKHRCQNAVESVKRFALNSPLLTSAEHMQ